jgi:hypothetical protein
MGSAAAGKATAEFTMPPGVKPPPAPAGTITSTNGGTQMIHQDELKIQTPDGKFAVIPSNMMPEGVLNHMQKQTGMSGMADGGTGTVAQPTSITPVATGITPIAQTATPAAASAPSGTISSTPAGITPTQTDADLNLSTSVIRKAAQGGVLPTDQLALNQTALTAGAGKADLNQQEAIAGVSPEALSTAQQVNDRNTNSTLATQEATMAANAKTAQVNAAQQLQSIAQAAKQYGDQEAQRAATDIQTGMSWETFHAMHPNITQGDFNNMKSIQQLPQTTTEYNAALAQYNSYVNSGQVDLAKQALAKLQDSKYSQLNGDLVTPNWDTVAKNDPLIAGSVATVTDNFIKSGLVPTQYLVNGKVSDTLKAQLSSDIQNAMSTGLITVGANGEPMVKSGAVLPWNDPTTFMDYTDWNGKPVAAGTQDLTQTVMDKTTGKVLTGTDGKPITFQDMNDAWGKLTPQEQESYFTGGQMDTKSFAASLSGIGLTPPVDTNTSGSDLTATVKNINDSLNSMINSNSNPVLSGAWTGVEAAIGANPTVQLYDKSGIPVPATSSILQKMYVQMSQYTNHGQPLSASQFTNLLSSEDWVTDDSKSGVLMNFADSSGGANSGNGYSWQAPNTAQAAWNPTTFAGKVNTGSHFGGARQIGLSNEGNAWVRNATKNGNVMSLGDGTKFTVTGSASAGFTIKSGNKTGKVFTTVQSPGQFFLSWDDGTGAPVPFSMPNGSK